MHKNSATISAASQPSAYSVSILEVGFSAKEIPKNILSIMIKILFNITLDQGF